MEIQIFDSDKKNLWDEFVSTNAFDGGLTQSWGWGQFKKTLGLQVFPLAAVDCKKIIAAALVIKNNLPLGQNYLYIPRGPVTGINVQSTVRNCLEHLFKNIQEIARQEGSIFLKIELAKIDWSVTDFGFKKSSAILPEESLLLNLSKPEEILLTEMKSKTRYNIGLAEKKGVRIIRVGASGNSLPKEFEEWWQMMKNTASRQEIQNFSKNYYQKLIENFSDNTLFLYLAEFNHEVIAANMVIYFGDFAYYFLGGQSYEHRELMAPHLLQWKQIQDAKKAGKKYYDFWGLSSTKKNWQGITRFKTGFAPQQPFTKYSGGFNYIYKPIWNGLYQAAKAVRS
ncbi:peptidoglycan bridge formation glycyltransferase FemA/FemB family protein [Candidatus Parcubacteria bacterium]|nr:MAG: peptidoglycan bridge formation glycyltransferase FemA/FemB family protein [Candidatus Parcubacteria bacterium]